MPGLPKDDRFKDNASRLANKQSLTALLASRLQEEDAERLEPRLLAAGVPAGVVRDVKSALQHPHTAHRNMVVEIGSYRGTGIPATLSRTPGSVRLPPPKFAEHALSILEEAGYSAAEVADLVDTLVVRVPIASD
jgi:crotonobetainyl-CoA:carnitine CoA-transferase CaiB-like acyl-CoA transferase